MPIAVARGISSSDDGGEGKRASGILVTGEVAFMISKRFRVSLYVRTFLEYLSEPAKPNGPDLVEPICY